MANKVPPVPYNQPIADESSRVPEIWADWFKQMLARVGGNTLAGSPAPGASGYQTLPSGLIIQWGVTGSVASGATLSVVFSAPFPSLCMQVIPGIKDNSAVATTQTGQIGSGNYSAAGFDLYNRTSIAHVLNWIAVGF